MITLTNIQECKADAVEVLWQLLQERPPEANISHDGKTTRAQHIAFVLGHPYREWCLIQADVEQAGTNHWQAWVGAIYITYQNEIGIGILKDYQRRGYARQAIDLMMQRHPRDYYLANVAPANHASHRLWESFANHAIIQLTYKVQRGASSSANLMHVWKTPIDGLNGRADLWGKKCLEQTRKEWTEKYGELEDVKLLVGIDDFAGIAWARIDARRK